MSFCSSVGLVESLQKGRRGFFGFQRVLQSSVIHVAGLEGPNSGSLHSSITKASPFGLVQVVSSLSIVFTNGTISWKIDDFKQMTGKFKPKPYGPWDRAEVLETADSGRSWNDRGSNA